MNPYSDSALKEAGWNNAVEREAFAGFMRRANSVVEAVSGLSLTDFADADWASLFEECGEIVSASAIIETLSEADDIFAAMAHMSLES